MTLVQCAEADEKIIQVINLNKYKKYVHKKIYYTHVFILENK